MEHRLIGKAGKLGPPVIIPLAPLAYWKKSKVLDFESGSCSVHLTVQLLPVGQVSPRSYLLAWTLGPDLRTQTFRRE